MTHGSILDCNNPNKSSLMFLRFSSRKKKLLIAKTSSHLENHLKLIVSQQ